MHIHSNQSDHEIRQAVEETYRSESRRVFATLVRLLRDFDLAEEAMHEAFALAATQWAETGVPTIRELGWFLRGGSRRLTLCDVGDGLMN